MERNILLRGKFTNLVSISCYTWLDRSTKEQQKHQGTSSNRFSESTTVFYMHAWTTLWLRFDNAIKLNLVVE